MNSRLAGSLGLAMRAGMIRHGEQAVLEAVREGSATLVIVAGDLSERSAKMYRDKCSHYGVPLAVCSDRETLGHAIGLPFAGACAVLDQGFADKISGLL